MEKPVLFSVGENTAFKQMMPSPTICEKPSMAAILF